MTILRRILRDERGATAVEYGLIIALMVVAMLTALNGFTGELVAIWNYVQTEVLAAI